MLSNRQGRFTYRGIFFAGPGSDDLLHPRASLLALTNLLSSDDLDPAEDKPWHFYSAQLMHYGLLDTTHKDLAKHRLRNALYLSELQVPPEILDRERRLSRA